jgi:hypothetical protein
MGNRPAYSTTAFATDSAPTRSVKPAASAGVRGRHCLAEPEPLVGSSAARDPRRVA